MLDVPSRRAAALQVSPLVDAAKRWGEKQVQFTIGERVPASVDVVGVQVDWASQPAAVVEAVRDARAKVPDDAAFAFFDYFDFSCSDFMAVLPHVNAYVKAQLPRDLAELPSRPGTGGRYRERMCEVLGMASPQGVDPEQVRLVETHRDKIHLGWTVGAGDLVRPGLFRDLKLARLERGVPPVAGRAHDVHLVVRTGEAGPSDWYYRHRAAAVEAVRALPAKIEPFLCVFESGTGKGLSPRQYLASMRSSKLCLSPLGYGEVCYRDYEAVAGGCVLVKPDIGHLRCEPDIYQAGVTYLPCRWDFADLGEVVERALGEPERMEAMAQAAREVLLRYHRQDRWLERLRDVTTKKPTA